MWTERERYIDSFDGIREYLQARDYFHDHRIEIFDMMVLKQKSRLRKLSQISTSRNLQDVCGILKLKALYPTKWIAIVPLPISSTK